MSDSEPDKEAKDPDLRSPIDTNEDQQSTGGGDLQVPENSPEVEEENVQGAWN